MQDIQRISSNWTLFLKVFLPTFWFVFYGAIVIAIFVMPENQLSISFGMKIGILIFYVSGSLVLYYTFMSLKRVEYEKDFLYVTNYFKTVRIPWHNVESFSEKSFGIGKIGSFQFKETITFGKRIHFLESRSLIQQFRESHPELMK